MHTHQASSRPHAPARVASAAAMHYHRKLRSSEHDVPPATYDAPPHAADAKAAEELTLIAAVARGESTAFERLYYLYAPRLARYLSRFLRNAQAVEEAINDVMLVVWQNAARYDPNAARLSTWMFGIAHNKALKSLARAGRHAAEVSYDAEDTHASDASFVDDVFARLAPSNPERETSGRQFGALLEWALDQLSDEHRGVIELAFGEQCGYDEIAAIMQCPTNTVKTRVFHARKKLAQLLASRGIDTQTDLRG